MHVQWCHIDVRGPSSPTPLLGYYYTPGGVKAGYQTVFVDTCISAELLPSKFKVIFAGGIFPPKKWISLFVEAHNIVNGNFKSEDKEIVEKEEGIFESYNPCFPTACGSGLLEQDNL